jgi:alpha-1,2-mannosyltransferase
MGHGWPFVDLGVYRYGGEAVLGGRDLYALRFPGALAFTYPPFSALVFTGLAPASMAVLKSLVTGLNLLLLPATLGLALRLRPLRGWLTSEQLLCTALLASAAALWLEPVWTTLRYGQIDLLIGALVLYDLSRPERSRWQGACLGLACALKLTPAIFAAYLLLTHRARAARLSALVFAATAALGFALLPADSRAYWGGAFIDPSRVGRIENAANQSLRGAFARLFHSLNVEPVWLCSGLVVALVGMGLAIAAGRRGDDVRGFSLCALSALLISPISWSHHWTLAVVALFLFCLTSYRRRSAAGLAAAAAVAVVVASQMIWWVPVNQPRHSELHLELAQLFYADAYVLVAICAIAAMAWSAARARGGRSRRPLALAPASGAPAG